jgi:Dynamin family
VGNSGIGKSSLINSILDKQGLIPTNPNKACTAVVTRISYCHGAYAHEAEIEYLTKDEWDAELKIMEATRHENSEEASISKSKVKVVYPDVDIETANLETLRNEPRVFARLGTKERIFSNNLDEFSKLIRPYVEGTHDDVGSSQQGSLGTSPQFWPLIKLVKIFVRSDALQGGLVLVDLPGSMDSNMARAAVAQKYKRECCHLLIVSDVVRVATDKTAHDLLTDDNAKRQLKMDGGLDAVTIVCTKTDNLTISEISTSLSLDPNGEITALDQLQEESRKQMHKLQQELESLYQKQTFLHQNASEEKDEDLLEQGQTDMDELSLKRKTAERKIEPRKRRQASEVEGSTSSSGRAVANKVKEMKSVSDAIRYTQEQLDSTTKEIQERSAQIFIKGLALRNANTKANFKSDFVKNIRQMDDDELEDDPDFDPSQDFRDYNALKSSLNVFCVSAKGYQQLKG